MNINKFISTLVVAYSFSKLLNNDDLDELKLIIYKKIYEILPIINISVDKLNFLFKLNNSDIDNKTKLDEINYRIDNLMSKINEEKIKNIPEKLYSLLRK